MKRLRWALVLALAIVAGGACVAETRAPWMTLVADGREYEGLLVSYCWSSLMAGTCADGILREPPVHSVRSDHPVAVQVRTRSGISELQVRVSADWNTSPFVAVDPAHADVLWLPAGTHYIAVGAWWPRGSGLFLFGLLVEPPS